MKETNQTRLQRRYLDRINKEANEKIKSITDRLLSAFTESEDPEGEAMTETFKKINAQWLVYCRHRQLNETAKKVVLNYMDQLVNEYRESKLDV